MRGLQTRDRGHARRAVYAMCKAAAHRAAIVEQHHVMRGCPRGGTAHVRVVDVLHESDG
jgi:hypothetical protein